MKIHTFIFHILQKMQNDLEGEATVSIHDVTKNNGVVLTGLTFSKKDVNISPTIYLENFYKEYQEGKSMEGILEEIKEIYYGSRMENSINMDFFTDYEKAKKNIVYKLINYEKNKELLKEIPHKKFLDLAIVFYYLVDMKEFANATILIHNKHLECWGKDADTIYHEAVKNTPGLLKVSFCGMMEVLQELTQEDILYAREMYELQEKENEDERKYVLEIHVRRDETGMYVLTNSTRMYGAATILYKDVLEKCSKALAANLFILPSSVHEVILLPDEGQITKEKLKEMVREVNETQIEPQEILSDSVYYFSLETGSVIRL